jgi:mono/diheme cytochrome c family protein
MKGLVLVLLLTACDSNQNLVPPDWNLNRMIAQPRYDPFGQSNFFADGRTMRTPPDGTVPRSRDLAPAEPPISLALLQDGRRHFETFCAPCHGITGDAQTVVAANMPLVKPPSLLSDRLRGLPPSHFYQVITTGYGMMPSYAIQLDDRERWAVAKYVRALQRSRSVPLNELPEALQARAREALP